MLPVIVRRRRRRADIEGPCGPALYVSVSQIRHTHAVKFYGRPRQIHRTCSHFCCRSRNFAGSLRAVNFPERCSTAHRNGVQLYRESSRTQPRGSRMIMPRRVLTIGQHQRAAEPSGVAACGGGGGRRQGVAQINEHDLVPGPAGPQPSYTLEGWRCCTTPTPPLLTYKHARGRHRHRAGPGE